MNPAIRKNSRLSNLEYALFAACLLVTTNVSAAFTSADIEIGSNQSDTVNLVEGEYRTISALAVSDTSAFDVSTDGSISQLVKITSSKDHAMVSNNVSSKTAPNITGNTIHHVKKTANVEFSWASSIGSALIFLLCLIGLTRRRV